LEKYQQRFTTAALDDVKKCFFSPSYMTRAIATTAFSSPDILNETERYIDGYD
jgi:hypothetical protein